MAIGEGRKKTKSQGGPHTDKSTHSKARKESESVQPRGNRGEWAHSSEDGRVLSNAIVV